MAVLPMPASLPYEPAFHAQRLGQRFPVGHPRLPDPRLDIKFPAHPVHQHFQVQLAHPGNHGLAGFIVVAHEESGIFLG